MIEVKDLKKTKPRRAKSADYEKEEDWKKTNEKKERRQANSKYMKGKDEVKEEKKPRKDKSTDCGKEEERKKLVNV